MQSAAVTRAAGGGWTGWGQPGAGNRREAVGKTRAWTCAEGTGQGGDGQKEVPGRLTVVPSGEEAWHSPARKGLLRKAVSSPSPEVWK